MKLAMLAVCLALVGCCDDPNPNVVVNTHYAMKCSDANNNSFNAIVRCENEEVVCYTLYGHGISCLPKQAK